MGEWGELLHSRIDAYTALRLSARTLRPFVEKKTIAPLATTYMLYVDEKWSKSPDLHDAWSPTASCYSLLGHIAYSI